MTQVGNTGWVAEGKLSYIIGDNKGKDPGPFTLKPVAVVEVARGDPVDGCAPVHRGPARLSSSGFVSGDAN